MTEGIKGKSGFQTTYKNLQNDILMVLETTKIKTSTVKERLVKLNRRKYKDIHYDWVKKTLLKMVDEGKISGMKDSEDGIYRWSKKEENDT